MWWSNRNAAAKKAAAEKAAAEKAAAEKAAAVFTAYARLWLFVEGLLHIRQSFLVPEGWWIGTQLAFYAAVAHSPTRAGLATAMLARVAMFATQAPNIWDSSIWANFTDLAFIGALYFYRSDDADLFRAAGKTIRVLMGIFYFAAGFWKMNTAHLDYTVSCSTIYVASLLAYLPEVLTPTWLITPILVTSPHVTILGECALGVCLVLPERGAHRLAVLLSAVLHLAIAFTPHPNSVPTFGLMCMVRLFICLPEAWTTALTEAFTLPASSAAVAVRVGAAAIAAGSAVFSSTPGWDVGPFFDPAIVVQVALCLICAYAIFIDWAMEVGEDLKEGFEGLGDAIVADIVKKLTFGLVKEKKKMPKQTPSSSAPLPKPWRLYAKALLYAACFYAFLVQPLGLVDISGASPFASIKLHGGSNHLFMPTGLLQRSSTAAAWNSNLGGGVVRVTASTSTHINSMYPSDCTMELRPRIKQLLLDGGHIGRQFNPTVRRTLGPGIRPYLYRWSPGEPFIKYTLPAMELRRTLAEARELNESFTLDYERLPGMVGDEKWRTTAVHSYVRIKEDGKGGRHCKTRLPGSARWRPCAPDEIAMQPAPWGLMMKTSLYFSLPILDGVDEVPCMD